MIQILQPPGNTVSYHVHFISSVKFWALWVDSKNHSIGYASWNHQYNERDRGSYHQSSCFPIQNRKR